MRVAIFGAGGVGAYFGGRLAQAGEDVTFIARGSHLEALRDNGLQVQSVAGDFVVKPAQATDDPAAVGEVDVVLVAVKAWQVPEAAAMMAPLVGSNTVVVPLENGVEAPDQLAAELGQEHVAGGLCRIISYIAAPGVIHHVGAEPYVAFGELDNRLSRRLERLRAAFDRAAGVTAEIPADIKVAMWRKFLLIATFSGVGAVTRAPIGVVRSRPKTRAMLQQALREIYDVGRARGVALEEEAIEAATTFMDNLPPEATASMQRDILEGRPSELESQNGAVVRLGAEAGVETPLHRFIYSALLPLELRSRGELDFSIT
ncbi:MAG: 2-dehydropantoate 2-reductase [Candidatus Promineifilaceae bacterium]|nr:2-dehydropantoate 2-reductase [Candidatus Promineifilaceae bacterium]